MKVIDYSLSDTTESTLVRIPLIRHGLAIGDRIPEGGEAERVDSVLGFAAHTSTATIAL